MARAPHAAPPTVEQISVSVAQASALTNISRSRIYELIASGRLQARKQGSRTVVLYDGLRQFVATLPPADIKVKPTGKGKTAATVIA
jgi:excisionase family DNA binding protein